ncbi:MAG TPA: hypothetical protein VGJ15_06505 [Pirellulales bacterium]
MPIVPILCGVLLITGIVALVLSATTWRWYHITITAFIMLLSLVWFYLAARTLQIQKAWRSEIANWEQAYAKSEANHEKIVNGGTDAERKEHLPLDRLKTEVDKLLQNRGRVWGAASPKIDPVNGQIAATIEKPEGIGIDKNTIVFVFDGTIGKSDGDTPQINQFLGEYEVVAGAGNNPAVTLQPVLKLRQSELQRIANTRAGSLVFFEVMPIDSGDLISTQRDLLPPDEKENADASNDKALVAKIFDKLPPAIQREYEKDGKPAEPNDPPEQIRQRVKAIKDFTVSGGQGNNAITQTVTAGTELLLDPQSAQQHQAAGDVEFVKDENGRDVTVYVRPLRDYARLYRDLNLEIEETLRKTAVAHSQLLAVQAAQKQVEVDLSYRQKEQAALERDKAHYNEENAMIKAHVAALEKRIAEVNEQIATAEAEIRAKEAELTKLVHNAAESINSRVTKYESPIR